MTGLEAFLPAALAGGGGAAAAGAGAAATGAALGSSGLPILIGAAPAVASSGILGGLGGMGLLKAGSLGLMGLGLMNGMMNSGGEAEKKSITDSDTGVGAEEAMPANRTIQYPGGRHGFDPEHRFFSTNMAEGGLIGYAEGGMVEGENDLIMATKQALMGAVPNAQEVISQFIQQFGMEAFEMLRREVIKQMGPSYTDQSGTSDSIPAQVDGQQPVNLSSGEYVVPADVVSNMGDGDTRSGGQRLDQMVASVRQQKHGTPQQPPDFNQGIMQAA